LQAPRFAQATSAKRHFDAGDAGLLDDAAADVVLLDFELSAAGALAVDESVFDD
jgi:hypothetical protein